MKIEEKCQGEGNCIVKQKDGVYFVLLISTNCWVHGGATIDDNNTITLDDAFTSSLLAKVIKENHSNYVMLIAW